MASLRWYLKLSLSLSLYLSLSALNSRYNHTSVLKGGDLVKFVVASGLRACMVQVIVVLSCPPFCYLRGLEVLQS
ncbi:unnamed protein product [Brassica rapa subsp. trilocularis]